MNSRNIVIITMIILLNVLNSQTASEIREMQQLYEQYKKGQIPGLTQLEIDKTDQVLDGVPVEYDLLIPKIPVDTVSQQVKYFGYEFFSRRDTILFWPNISTPENYILGPGDNIEISLWGRAQVNESYVINRDGNIYDKSIGIIHLSSKTLKEARMFLKNRFAQKISSLIGKNPTSFINVTLGELKSINVHFIGNVKLPGVHLVHPMSTITTGLIQAGGIDTTGSLRKIQIHRNGELHREIDFYGYLLDGDISENILLQNDDIVNVPTRISTITIEGEVYRGGKFEALENEELADIVQYAGGLKPNAASEMILQRIIPMDRRSVYLEPVEYKTITTDQLNTVVNQDGDVLTINSIPEIINEVYISGQVKNPGSYVLTDLMTVKDILIRAGGIEDENYLKSVYLDQIQIIRVDENNEYNTTLELNLKDLLATDKFDKYLLQKDDHIVVHKNIYYQKDNNIQITGEVAVPGTYPITKTDESLREIINRAGGFTDKAFTQGLRINRGDKRLVWKTLSVALVKGDSIFVPEKPGVVEVQGEVYNPGLISFKKGRSVMSYVNSAGGLTENTNRFNISLVYPNGNVKPVKLIPLRVTEGCIIIANRKPEKEPFDLGNFLTESLSIMSSVALIYVALDRIK